MEHVALYCAVVFVYCVGGEEVVEGDGRTAGWRLAAGGGRGGSFSSSSSSSSCAATAAATAAAVTDKAASLAVT
jgi:hypothetical protein